MTKIDAKTLQADVAAALDRRPDKRSLLRIVSDQMRLAGHSGWSSKSEFGTICRQLGFFVYEANSRYGLQYFVSLEEKPDEVPDEFVQTGFVIRFEAGQFVNRSNPPALTAFKSSAKVWKTRQGIARYCARHGYQEAMICHTRDIACG